MKETRTISFINIPHELFKSLQYLEPKEAGELLQSLVLSVEAEAEGEQSPDILAVDMPFIDIRGKQHSALFCLYMILRGYAEITTSEREPE